MATPGSVPYRGKRVGDYAPEELLTEYIGRRVARPAHPENLHSASTPTTGELEALVSLPMEDTAPRPRVPADFGWTPQIVAQPRPARALFVPTAREGMYDSSVHLPAVTLAAAYAADLSSDTTTTLQAVGSSGRRRAATSKRRHRARSLPLVAGVLTIAGAGIGAYATSAYDSRVQIQAEIQQQWLATATDASDVGAVGVRTMPVSRALSRSTAALNNAAAAHERALAETNLQAAGWDKQLSSNLWITPITPGGYTLTGRFGQYSGLWSTFHTGLDFACANGTPIHAIMNGTITSVGWGGAYGNLTEETLADGTVVYYAHQSAFGVSIGQKVTRDEVIGYVGATGNVTGPHVHLEIRPGGGDPVDPDEALRLHGVNPDALQ
ncbi:hypothetical protein Back2_09270 [Nocardioides baekrokdamisoli]|uniref:M23ase beta-sheet core domain-containing protein n=1 Tax=Nocardioides baekrokdamisoli TaxID=1804624 RepID=A0A3G9ICG8_9ACTN|nr:hypothetical protein Back2_09270 [Nocardioides baekrokdamisoli]